MAQNVGNRNLWLVSSHLLGTPIAIFTSRESARLFILAQKRPRDYDFVTRPLDPPSQNVENFGDFLAAYSGPQEPIAPVKNCPICGEPCDDSPFGCKR